LITATESGVPCDAPRTRIQSVRSWLEERMLPIPDRFLRPEELKSRREAEAESARQAQVHAKMDHSDPRNNPAVQRKRAEPENVIERVVKFESIQAIYKPTWLRQPEQGQGGK